MSNYRRPKFLCWLLRHTYDGIDCRTCDEADRQRRYLAHVKACAAGKHELFPVPGALMCHHCLYMRKAP
jgi:hypothetical protein